jgi:hypothetical protein
MPQWYCMLMSSASGPQVEEEHSNGLNKYGISSLRHRGDKGRGETEWVFSALSAGALTTTWLVTVTLSTPVAVSKQDFQAWKQKIPFPLVLYIKRYFVILTNLFKYVAELWQWHLAALHTTGFLHRVLTCLGINDWHHKTCSPATFLNPIWARWQSGQWSGL